MIELNDDKIKPAAEMICVCVPHHFDKPPYAFKTDLEFHTNNYELQPCYYCKKDCWVGQRTRALQAVGSDQIICACMICLIQKGLTTKDIDFNLGGK